MLVVNKESDSPLPSPGCKPEQQMMYAGSKNRLVQAAELTKVLQSPFDTCALCPQPLGCPSLCHPSPPAEIPLRVARLQPTECVHLLDGPEMRGEVPVTSLFHVPFSSVPLSIHLPSSLAFGRKTTRVPLATQAGAEGRQMHCPRGEDATAFFFISPARGTCTAHLLAATSKLQDWW